MMFRKVQKLFLLSLFVLITIIVREFFKLEFLRLVAAVACAHRRRRARTDAAHSRNRARARVVRVRASALCCDPVTR